MSIRVIPTVVSLLPNLNQKRLRQSLIVLVAGLFLLATFDADARRRALRVEFLDWTNPVLVVPSADCPGTSSTNSLVVEPVKASVGLDMTGFVFDSSDNALLLNGRYCQEGNRFTGSEFSDEYLNAESFDPVDDPGMRALIGTNEDNAVQALRYTFLTAPFDPNNTPGPDDAGFQWAFFTFPGGVTLVRFTGDFVEPGPDGGLEPILRAGATELFNGYTDTIGSSGYDGEYFCFRGEEFLGFWDETTFQGRDPSSGCAQPNDVGPTPPGPTPDPDPDPDAGAAVAIPVGNLTALGSILGILLLAFSALRSRAQVERS